MDEVTRSGEPLVISRNGSPVAQLSPFAGRRVPSPFRLHAGKLEVREAIIEPSDTSEWETLQ